MRRKTVTILIMTLIMSIMAGCGKEEAPIEVEVVETPEVVEPEEWESLEISTLMNTYYRQLAQLEKDVYKQVLYEITNGNHVINICRGLDAKGVDNVVKSIEYDNPELFWITGGYTFDGDTLTIETNKLADDLEANKEKFNKAIEEIMEDIYFPYKADDYIKERLIHDKLLNSLEYDEDTELGYTAYEALVNGKASCSGYSKAFQLLMQKSGVPCYYSVGRLYQGGTTTGHAWNAIRLGDNHYYVDVTLNDTVLGKFGAISYEFYNLNSEDLKDSHNRNAMSLGLPAIDGTDLKYEEIYGESCAEGAIKQLGLDKSYVVNNLDEFNKYVVNKLNANGLGEHTFKVIVSTDELHSEIHYAIRIKIQEYLDALNELNKKGWNKLSIETESYSLGDEHYLLEVSTNLEYVEPPKEEVNEESNNNSSGVGGW